MQSQKEENDDTSKTKDRVLSGLWGVGGNRTYQSQQASARVR